MQPRLLIRRERVPVGDTSSVLRIVAFRMDICSLNGAERELYVALTCPGVGAGSS